MRYLGLIRQLGITGILEIIRSILGIMDGLGCIGEVVVVVFNLAICA